MQALEQQVGELKIDADDGCYDGAQGDTGDSRPSSGASTALNHFFDHTSDMLVVKSFIHVLFVIYLLSLKPVNSCFVQ